MFDVSRAVHVTFVGPRLNVDPETGVQMIDGKPTLSVAVAAGYVT